MIFSGDVGRGLAERLKVYEHNREEPLAVAGMVTIDGILQQRDEALRWLEELHGLARRAWVPPLAFAWAYLGLGDERVFEWLDKAIDARDPAVTHLPSMPNTTRYAAIPVSPRFLPA